MPLFYHNILILDTPARGAEYFPKTDEKSWPGPGGGIGGPKKLPAPPNLSEGAGESGLFTVAAASGFLSKRFFILFHVSRIVFRPSEGRYWRRKTQEEAPAANRNLEKSEKHHKRVSIP